MFSFDFLKNISEPSPRRRNIVIKIRRNRRRLDTEEEEDHFIDTSRKLVTSEVRDTWKT